MRRIRTDAEASGGASRGRAGWHRSRLPVTTLLAVWLICAALAACGTTLPPNTFHQCGEVHVAAGRVLPGDATAARAAEDCFAHDYASCQAATLTYTEMGVDTGTTHTFTEAPSNGHCAVTDTVRAYTANGGGHTFPAQTYACAGVEQRADGLHMSNCGHEYDVLVPAPTAS